MLASEIFITVLGILAVCAFGWYAYNSPIWHRRKKVLQFEILDEALTSIEAIAQFTSRSNQEVIIDALRTYEWILGVQAEGDQVVVESSNPEREVDLVNYITDQEQARKFFEVDQPPDSAITPAPIV